MRAQFFPGLSLREIIHEYKHQTLVLFKCCLLQPKVTILLQGGITIPHADRSRCSSLALTASDCA